MSISREAVALFEELLDDISKQNNPRPHKRIKFVNRNLLDCKMMESKLQQYFENHFDEEERYHLAQSLVDAEGECRVCECLLYLIQHVEKRIEKHQEIFCSICEMIQEARNIEDDDDLLAEVVTKCSLLVYDSFHCLCSLKRLIKYISTSYQVPYYYDTDDTTYGTIRLRSSLLSTFKNLNTIIDDLVILGDVLWILRSYDCL